MRIFTLNKNFPKKLHYLQYILHKKGVWLWVLPETRHLLNINKKEIENTNFSCKCLFPNAYHHESDGFCRGAGAFCWVLQGTINSSPSSHLFVTFSVYLPFPLCLLSLFQCVLYFFPLFLAFCLLPSPRSVSADVCAWQNVWASASDPAFPTRTSKAREPMKTASAFHHTCQAGLRSPPV